MVQHYHHGWEMQDSSGVEGDKSVPFIPAKTFSGTKKGYVFKNGEQGLGYYTDRHARNGDKTAVSI